MRKIRADKASMKVLGRLVVYVLKHYKAACLFTMFFIVISSLASVASSLEAL